MVGPMAIPRTLARYADIAPLSRRELSSRARELTRTPGICQSAADSWARRYPPLISATAIAGP